MGRLGVIDIRDIRDAQAGFLMLIQNSLRSKYIIELSCSQLIWPIQIDNCLCDAIKLDENSLRRNRQSYIL